MKDKDIKNKKASVFNKKQYNPVTQHMFFGEELGIQRYDVQRHPVFERLNRRMIGFFWIPEEVSMTSDREDYHTRLDDGERHVFLSNLKYQILLDSVQGRALNQAFVPVCSLPELEGSIETAAFFECIHSRSYTHIVRSIFDDASDVFDSIVINPEILQRAVSVTAAYEDFIDSCNRYRYGNNPDNLTMRNLKEKLFDAIVSVNILESIRFFVSFACNLALDYQKKMPGAARIITLIARDEACHHFMTRNIINLWANGLDDPEMKEIYNERKDIATEMYRAAAEQEKAWAEYLFSKGSMRGLNEKILSQYVEYTTEKAMIGIGLEPIYKDIKHPIQWIESYFNTELQQNAPQENEITAYVSGSIDDTLADDDFGDFDF